MGGLVCLECWVTVDSDPFHFDCTGEHFVPRAEAVEIRTWISGLVAFMDRTGQRESRPNSGAVV